MSFKSLKNLQIPRNTACCFLVAGTAGAAVCALLFLGTGCKTYRPPDPMAEAVESGEHPVAMKGDANFFDGKVAATVTISRGFGRGSAHPGGGKGGGRKDREKDAASAGLDDSYPSGLSGDASESEQREMYEDMVRYDRARRAAGSPMPPVTIRLKLENHAADAAEVEILELNSDLGNFAVRPAKLSLANGQTGETDPMISQLGVTSDEIPMKVVLRIAGKKETQVIPVKSLFTKIEKK